MKISNSDEILNEMDREFKQNKNIDLSRQNIITY